MNEMFFEEILPSFFFSKIDEILAEEPNPNFTECNKHSKVRRRNSSWQKYTCWSHKVLLGFISFGVALQVLNRFSEHLEHRNLERFVVQRPNQNNDEQKNAEEEPDAEDPMFEDEDRELLPQSDSVLTQGTATPPIVQAQQSVQPPSNQELRPSPSTSQQSLPSTLPQNNPGPRAASSSRNLASRHSQNVEERRPILRSRISQDNQGSQSRESAIRNLSEISDKTMHSDGDYSSSSTSDLELFVDTMKTEEHLAAQKTLLHNFKTNKTDASILRNIGSINHKYLPRTKDPPPTVKDVIALHTPNGFQHPFKPGGSVIYYSTDGKTVKKITSSNLPKPEVYKILENFTSAELPTLEPNNKWLYFRFQNRDENVFAACIPRESWRVGFLDVLNSEKSRGHYLVDCQNRKETNEEWKGCNVHRWFLPSAETTKGQFCGFVEQMSKHNLRILFCADLLQTLQFLKSKKLHHNDIRPMNYVFDGNSNRLTMIDWETATVDEPFIDRKTWRGMNLSPTIIEYGIGRNILESKAKDTWKTHYAAHEFDVAMFTHIANLLLMQSTPGRKKTAHLWKKMDYFKWKEYEGEDEVDFFKPDDFKKHITNFITTRIEEQMASLTFNSNEDGIDRLSEVHNALDYVKSGVNNMWKNKGLSYLRSWPAISNATRLSLSCNLDDIQDIIDAEIGKSEVTSATLARWSVNETMFGDLSPQTHWKVQKAYTIGLKKKGKLQSITPNQPILDRAVAALGEDSVRKNADLWSFISQLHRSKDFTRSEWTDVKAHVLKHFEDSCNTGKFEICQDCPSFINNPEALNLMDLEVIKVKLMREGKTTTQDDPYLKHLHLVFDV